MKIKAQVVCSFVTMLTLLAAVAGVAIDRTGEIGKLAGDLNGRVVDKTRIAANIVDLGLQLRALDGVLLASGDPNQDLRTRSLIDDRIRAADLQIASYTRYADADLERRLLQNLERSRQAYLALEREIGVGPAGDGQTRAGRDADLSTAFDQMNRQARGLSRLAETEARAARETAVGLVDGARIAVLSAAAGAVAIGLMILGVLLVSVFQPLARITEALTALSQGRLDATPFASGRGGEVDDMARALDVFRSNAVALSAAHEETKAAHQRADALARHDALTGLPNRRVLTATIADAMARSRRRGHACSILVLDLDRFKPINDIYGHGAGDKVLCAVAERLNATVRSGEVAARLGGDEFAVVLEHEPGSDAPYRVAKRIIASVGAPIAIDDCSVTVGTSVGIALWPSDGDDPESLLRAADLAMYKAKREDRGGFRSFEIAMDVQLRARADLEARICLAIRGGHIRPHYQPLVDLQTQRMVGFEILSRWHDGDIVRAPGEFIQIADDAGLIPELTYSVLRQACRDARDWPEATTLAMNVTPAQISDLQFPGALLKLLEEEDFPARRLELEITENALIGDIASAKTVITALRTRGVRISLDDFGTGYSSLHHLRSLKFDKLKIDRSFVQSMLTDAESAKIIETILALTHSLGIFTVAEGIETGDHLDALTAHGCDFGQGYFLGRPLAADEIGRLIAGETPPVPRLTRAA